MKVCAHSLNKFTTNQTICLPISSKILSVKEVGEELVLYAFVDDACIMTDQLDVLILGTGKESPSFCNYDYKYLDTVIMKDGYAKHVFYR